MKVSHRDTRAAASAKNLPAGWNPVQLMKLSNQLDTIIDNFKKLTGQWSGLTLHFSAKSPSAKSGLISINHTNWRVTSYLGAGPTKVLAQAPLALARRLTLLDHEHGSSINLFTAVKMDFIDTWKQQIISRLTTDGGSKVLERLDALITSLIRKITRNLIDHRITLAQFDKFEIPKRTICRQIEQEIDDFREKIMQLSITLGSARKLYVLSEIAHFASLAVYADQLGHPELVSRARRLFSGEAAQNLAGIVLGLKIQANPNLAKQIPIFNQKYMHRASIGFEIQFMAFQNIFNAYYENVTIKPWR
jgi:hypothetical protein